MYIAPGHRQTAPREKNDVNRKALSLYPLVASFKKSLWSLILYILNDLIHVYSSRSGGRQPPGDKFFMSTETSCHFGYLMLVSNNRRQQFLKSHCFTVFPYESIREQI